MALELTAAAAALIPFETSLTVTPRTMAKEYGRTAWTKDTVKTFEGALVAPKVFSQLIAPGGIDDAADQLLAVGQDLLDSEGSSLSITKDDWIEDVHGNRFRVLKHMDGTDLVGFEIFELAKERTVDAE